MRTLFVLPNAIGDVICGTGIARRFAKDGPVTWFVNPSAEAALDCEHVTILSSPSSHVRRMAEQGAPTETVWREADRFLESIKTAGPWDRVVNVHLSRASSIVAGAAADRAKIVRGPALTDRVFSHAWADFFLSSVLQGLAPELPVPARFSVIAGLPEPAWPDWSSLAAQSGGIAFIPGSGWPSKALGADQASRIARQLADLAPVRLIGGPKEREFLETVRTGAGNRAEIAPIGSLAHSIDALLKARIVVTTDTWSLHAACAARIPVVAILGPTRVMPWRNGLALSPDKAPSWKSDDDRSIEKIDANDVTAAAAALVSRSEPPPPAEGTILWDCRQAENDFAWPRPHRPPRLDGSKELLAWARARAFSSCVSRMQPGEPTLAVRPNERIPELAADTAAVAHRVRAQLTKAEDRFPLFETTFPGEDPARVTRVWIEETAAELTRLIER